jgi:hypothetical protein
MEPLFGRLEPWLEPMTIPTLWLDQYNPLTSIFFGQSMWFAPPRCCALCVNEYTRLVCRQASGAACEHMRQCVASYKGATEAAQLRNEGVIDNGRIALDCDDPRLRRHRRRASDWAMEATAPQTHGQDCRLDAPASVGCHSRSGAQRDHGCERREALSHPRRPIRVDVGPPIFFWQERLGRKGRPFLIYKFRTLKAPFDSTGHPTAGSRRPSAAGRFLRATRLDELPQLLNVLFGEMSMIGPRPLLPEDQPTNTSIRLSVRPGISGWGQVNGAKLVTKKEKQRLDEWYVHNASL